MLGLNFGDLEESIAILLEDGVGLVDLSFGQKVEQLNKLSEEEVSHREAISSKPLLFLHVGDNLVTFGSKGSNEFSLVFGDNVAGNGRIHLD